MNSKKQLQAENFVMIVDTYTLDVAVMAGRAKGKGFHRTIKDFLRDSVFNYMQPGDYIYIRKVVESEDTTKLYLHLNRRLLEKAEQYEALGKIAL